MQFPHEHPRAEKRSSDAVRRAVIAAKRGDVQAVRFLYARFAVPVRNYVSTLLGDRDVAEDVMQTTFMKLLLFLDRYEPSQAPFEAWLLRVARNTALDEVRKQRPAHAGPVEEHMQPEPEPRSRELVAALEELPVPEREVLVLRHVVGLTSTEVARRLERTPASVETLHERGRDKLRSALASGAAETADGTEDFSRRRQLREARASAARRRSVERIAG